jgi:ethanolamine utilization protein EutN
MIIGRIIGNVVATRKDPRLEGVKLLLVRPLNLRGEDESGYLVAIDSVGAGYREKVLVVSGSSARMADGMKDKPVDAVIVGIIDTVEVTD